MPIRGVLIILSVCIVTISIVKRVLDRRAAGREEDPEIERDLNEEFFTNAEGETSIPFMRIYNNQDEMIIRSILDSAGILSYQDKHHVGDLLPGVRVQGSTGAILYIYESNREKAEELVVDYIRNQAERLMGKELSTRQALADAVALLNATPSGQNQILPEFITEDETE